MKPSTSHAPTMLAAGVMLVAWGVISHWPVALVGLLLSVGALWKWIQESEGEQTK